MIKPDTLKMTWKQYRKSIKFFENYFRTTINGHDNLYFMRQREPQKIDYWKMFNELYQHMLSSVPKEIVPNRYYVKQILITYDCYNPPYEMTAMIKFSSETYGATVIWSKDVATQSNVKEMFTVWSDIEQYYNHIVQCVEKQHLKRGTSVEEMSQRMKEQAHIKQERRKKRELNDSDNPAARKRKARRHLQRLGYDLRKSRKIATTAVDKGLYQIIKVGTKEIIAGEQFDLSLEQVELFYMDADIVRANDPHFWHGYMSGYYYNREPNLERRKQAAIKALKKMGYVLEVDPQSKEYYKAQCYRILKKSKRPMSECKNFLSLDEVEQFIAGAG